jgi:EAL domain-containing protein (putative c-di-GMP-specific phosphodiesterase class I)
VLKVDRSFVAAMDGSPTHAALLEGIVAMGAHLGLTTVVEGIETEAQLERVRGYGATLVQGFLLGAPGPLTAARAARVA